MFQEVTIFHRGFGCPAHRDGGPANEKGSAHGTDTRELSVSRLSRGMTGKFRDGSCMMGVFSQTFYHGARILLWALSEICFTPAAPIRSAEAVGRPVPGQRFPWRVEPGARVAAPSRRVRVSWPRTGRSARRRFAGGLFLPGHLWKAWAWALHGGVCGDGCERGEEVAVPAGEEEAAERLPPLLL